MLEQLAQRICACLIIGSVQCQVAQGFEQPDFSERCPSLWQSIGLDH